jgi:hypothetical protein
MELTPVEVNTLTEVDIHTGDYADRFLLEFAQEIEKKLRGIKFGKRPHSMFLYAFMPDDAFAMGRVGYYNNNYNVQSRLIINGRFRSHSPEHHIKQSRQLKTAVKTACAALRRYSVEDYARYWNNAFQSAVSSDVSSRRREFSNPFYKLLGTYTSPHRLLRELQHLLDTGHMFVDPQFGETLREAMNAKAEFEADSPDNKPAVFVMLGMFGDKQTFNIAQVRGHAVEVDPVVYTQDTLPEGIMGRLSVLNMLSPGGYVSGIGYRATDKVFYAIK